MIIIAVCRGWLIAAMVLALLGCGETNHEDKVMVSIAQVSVAEWQALAQKRIIFGHQSVGRNILNGIRSLTAQAGISLQIIESRELAADANIIHFSVGQNEDPLSKIADFVNTLDKGIMQGANIALMKLCYVDINDNTNTRQLAEQYSTMLDHLNQKFPHTTFVAVTVPLTIVQATGLKAWIKRLLGRTPSGYADNARRQEFNEILRVRYSQQGRLFDLAKIEAEDAGAYEYEGRPIEVLNPALTSDHGHLNTQGQKKVAAELIKFLAALPSR